MSKKILKPVSLAAGAFVLGGLLSGSAFAMTDLAQGYLLSAGDEPPAQAEGKCGEGKCGGEHQAGAAAGAAPAEGRCGEGHCGAEKGEHEGACGGAHGAAAQAAGAAPAAGATPAEGKCGEGKCGGNAESED